MSEFRQIKVEETTGPGVRATAVPRTQSHGMHQLLRTSVAVTDSLSLRMLDDGSVSVRLDWISGSAKEAKVNGKRVKVDSSKELVLPLELGKPLRIEWDDSGVVRSLSFSIERQADVSEAEVAKFRKQASDAIYASADVVLDLTLIGSPTPITTIDGLMQLYDEYGAEKFAVLLEHFLPHWARYTTLPIKGAETEAPALSINLDYYGAHRFRGFNASNVGPLEMETNDSIGFANALVGEVLSRGEWKLSEYGVHSSRNPLVATSFASIGFVSLKSTVDKGTLKYNPKEGEAICVISGAVRPDEIDAIYVSHEARLSAISKFKARGEEIRRLFGKDLESLLVGAWAIEDERKVARGALAAKGSREEFNLHLFRAVNEHLEGM